MMPSLGGRAERLGAIEGTALGFQGEGTRTALSRRLWLARVKTRIGEAVRVATVFRKLLGVTGLLVSSVAFEEDGLIIDVRPRWRRPRCGECCRQRPAYDQVEPRLWRHLALGRQVFWLRYATRRVEFG